MRQVEELAEAHGSRRVVTIRVQLGEFSGVDPELFENAYAELVPDTPLDGAALELKQVPLEATCSQCGKEFRIERFRFECTACGSSRLALRGGEELLLESVTLEGADDE
jgi:hydrogenase nickel incorporation protein HypA/HybF